MGSARDSCLDASQASGAARPSEQRASPAKPGGEEARPDQTQIQRSPRAARSMP
jgi:hypothetical protein